MRKEEFKEVLAEFGVPFSLYGDMTYHGLHLGYYTEVLKITLLTFSDILLLMVKVI